jgi:hypothetical protein
MRGIYRIDHPSSRTHSWLVTVQRRNCVFNRHFTDGVYGGKAKALAAARAYRASLLQRLPALTKREFCAITKKNNTSGISGVSRHEAPGRTPTSPRQVFWLAQWPIGKRRAKKRKFSVKKYGEDGAFRRAIAARRRALDLLG